MKHADEKSELGDRLQTAIDNRQLHSSTHIVRWHKGKTEGGWYDKIAELYFANGRLVEFVRRKRKRKPKQPELI